MSYAVVRLVRGFTTIKLNDEGKQQPLMHEMFCIFFWGLKICDAHH